MVWADGPNLTGKKGERTMPEKRIFLASPCMNGQEMAFIEEAFATNWVAPLGKNVDAFEEELAAYVGAKHAAALSAGTAAIHLALKCAGVGQGDLVFSSALTFAATCNPILYEKGIPVFLDSEEESWNMDPAALELAFAKYPQVKAVIVANLYGIPAKLNEIAALCKEHHVALIEDAAESLGSSLDGKMTGTFGDYGIFSFNGNKIITTSGGGMLVSDDEAAIAKARFWATQSREKARHYEHKEVGYNYRMSNISAGIGRGQLKTLDLRVRQKQSIYDRYAAAFASIPEVKMSPRPENSVTNCWLSCLTIDPKSPVKPLDVMVALERENIESRPIWKPMQLQPLYRGCDFIQAKEGRSVSETIYETGVCLPSDVNMTEADQARVIGIILGLFGR